MSTPSSREHSRDLDRLFAADPPLTIIAGPCLLEEDPLNLAIAELLRDQCRRLDLGFVFKGSFDKANRSSVSSPRGPGLEEGLRRLGEVRRRLGVPVTTDVHEPAQAAPAAQVVDLLQIPAFLCRQTDLLAAAGRTGRAVNVKKGQFMAPREMLQAIRKVREAGGSRVIVTERGTFFGYHRLVNDFAGLGDLIELAAAEGVPTCFDATHSTQLPGAEGTASAGRPERAALLARAAVVSGVSAVFLECHPKPRTAPSDASSMLALDEVPALLESLAALRRTMAPWLAGGAARSAALDPAASSALQSTRR